MAINTWRMPENVHGAEGLIGPNAILQLLPVIDRLGGPERRARMLASAGIFDVPDGQSMIRETDAARLHQQLRREEPEMAPALAGRAGTCTADYILRHRIPAPAQWLLTALPAGSAARLLARAINQHAWTFVGSGTLRVVDAWTFEIRNNPLIAGETSDHCLCHWHVGVFSQLYQTLVTPACRCAETRCGAAQPDDCCRFEVRRYLVRK